MQFSVLHNDSAFDVLDSSWRALIPQSYADTPFQTTEFLKNWWSTRGGGEWVNPALWLGTAKDGTGEVRGVAPLFRQQDEQDLPRYMFLGSVEIADYLDFIVREADAPDFLNQVLDQVQTQEPGGAVLDLVNLREESPSAGILIASAKERGWQWSMTEEQVCPFIPLGSDWETYLEGLKKKHRHEIRRKLRRLAENTSQQAFRIVDGDHVVGLMPEFLDLMLMDEEKKDFLTVPMRDFFLELAADGSGAGWLKMAVLQVEHELAAAYLFFDHSQRILMYNAAFHPAAQSLSPGWVLLSKLIQWGIDNGRTELDFMRGDEAYKYRFGGVDRSVNRLQIQIS